MKRTAIIFLLMLSAATAAQAQNNLFDILKGAASAAVDKATDGAFTSQRIIGSWSYAKPGLRLSSDNALSEIAAAAAVSTVEDKISKYYEMVGIREGACTFVFNSDGTFTSTVGAKTINGRYTMDGANHTLNITFGTAERPAAEKLGLNKGINRGGQTAGRNRVSGQHNLIVAGRNLAAEELRRHDDRIRVRAAEIDTPNV